MTDRRQIPRRQLQRFLDLNYGAVVLIKNPDLWASMERGGDWDLVVKDLSNCLSSLITCLGTPSWVDRRSYVTSVHWSWGNIDLLPDLRWRGVRLVAESEIFAAATSESSEILVASAADQAIASCVFPAMSYGHVKDRYQVEWNRAQHDDYGLLTSRTRDVFGAAPRVQDLAFDQLESGSSWLRSLAWQHAIRHDRAGLIWRSLDFVKSEAVNDLRRALRGRARE